MNNREYFHESVVRDVVDLLSSVKDFDEVQFLSNSSTKRSFKSITSATKDLILTFPVMVSSDIDPSNAMMIAKAHEKKCAALLHILFTAICINSSEDVYDYVRKFHTNLGSMDATFDDYVDSLDKIGSMVENYQFTGTIDKQTLDIVLREMKETNYTLPDDIKQESISDYRIVPGYGLEPMIIKEAKNPPQPSLADLSAKLTVQSADIKKQSDDINQLKDTINNADYIKNVRSSLDNLEDDISRTRSKLVKHYEDNIKNRETIAKTQESEYKNMQGTILNAEYKKANELMPTMMVINFVQKGESDSAPLSHVTAVIGVKAKLYPVSSTDICNRISSKIADKNILNSFIRATTNEIGFFRDFLFAIDKAKLDALSYGRKSTSNKLWKVLERRSIKSKFRRSMKMYNDATAITTLVLSSDDAEYLKKNHNVDIMNVNYARKLLDSYNLMGLCIVNEATEVVSFLYDTGDDNYEKLTFSNLEREASDNSYKKIVNLLTKVSR